MCKLPNYYILNNNNKIVNVIVADTKEIAEEVTGLVAIEQVPGEKIDAEWDFLSSNPSNESILES